MEEVDSFWMSMEGILTPKGARSDNFNNNKDMIEWRTLNTRVESGTLIHT